MTEINNSKKTTIGLIGFSKVIQIQETFIDEYLSDANGDYVKVYLMLLRYMNSTDISIEDIAIKLDLTTRKIIKAIKYWESVGLINLTYSSTGAITNIDCVTEIKKNNITKAHIEKKDLDIIEPEQENNDIPDFSEVTHDSKLIEKLNKDENFKFLLQLYSAYNPLSFGEKQVSVLCYLYHDLKLSSEVIDHLLEYVFNQEIHNVNYIAKVGKNWAKSKVNNIEDAKLACANYNKKYNNVLKHLGIDSKLTPKHIKMFDSWFAIFPEDIIIEACDIAIEKKGKASISYVDKIIQNWKESNVKTRLDIERLNINFIESRNKKKLKKTKDMNSFANYPQRSLISNEEESDDFLMYMTRDA